MEPKLPAPNIGPERAPQEYAQNFEQAPLPPSPEIRQEQAAEHVEQRSEATPAAVNAAPMLPTPVAFPMPGQPVIDDAQTTAGIGSPSIAADDDVIEKEWVDKAKNIISSTRDDPHKRE
ncbi:MAG: hypothetical protein ABJA64_00760, partial [Candidatus Saccharibacteria bacterium]